MRTLLARLHRAIERRTGLVFGLMTTTGSFTNSGYPLEHAWLVMVPRRDGYAFCISVKKYGIYLDYVPRHEVEHERTPA